MADEIIKVIDSLAQKMGIAVDWGSGNVVPYLNELMARHAIGKQIYLTVIFIVFLIISILIITITVKTLKKSCGIYSAEGICVLILIGGIVIIVGVLTLEDVINAYVFPEILFLRDIKNMIN